MRTPTWAQIERFCQIDGWHEVRRSDHVFYEMVLPDSSVLRTHRSFWSRKTMSPGRFKAILRYQLRVTEDQFWQALETRFLSIAHRHYSAEGHASRSVGSPVA